MVFLLNNMDDYQFYRFLWISFDKVLPLALEQSEGFTAHLPLEH